MKDGQGADSGAAAPKTPAGALCQGVQPTGAQYEPRVLKTGWDQRLRSSSKTRRQRPELRGHAAHVSWTEATAEEALEEMPGVGLGVGEFKGETRGPMS